MEVKTLSIQKSMMTEKRYKKLLILTMMMLSLLLPAKVLAVYRVVTDPQTTATVLTNTLSQMAIEREHNKRLDSINAKQKKIELYTVSMATMKEVYKLTMENIKGFGEESWYYTEIGRCAYDIIKDVPEVTKVVKDAKWHNQLLCLGELAGVGTKTQKLVNDFVNIVNNGKIRNPLGDNSGESGENDGYNLLDRYERLSIANRIYTDLLELRYKIQGMMAMAQYATMNDLFFAIDPEGWANVMVMQNAVSGLIDDWNNTGGVAWDKVTIDRTKLDPIFQDIVSWGTFD